jgi:uncharacterized protein involved in propanediol utilization
MVVKSNMKDIPSIFEVKSKFRKKVLSPYMKKKDNRLNINVLEKIMNNSIHILLNKDVNVKRGMRI